MHHKLLPAVLLICLHMLCYLQCVHCPVWWECAKQRSRGFTSTQTPAPVSNSSMADAELMATTLKTRRRARGPAKEARKVRRDLKKLNALNHQFVLLMFEWD